MPSQSSRHRAVEDVNAQGDEVEEVVRLADSQEMLRCVSRQERNGQLEHSRHLVLVAAERAADRDAVDRRGAYALGRAPAKLLVDAALDDPEDGLTRWSLALVPLEAAVQPAVGPLGRPGGVVQIGVIRRALVEDQRDVGAERGLDAHRLLGAHEALDSVQVGAKAHPLLGDVEDGAVVACAAAPALDLVRDVPVCEREDLEATRVGDDRPVPVHELVQAAERADVLVAWSEVEVERVPQDHLVAERRHLVGIETPDRARRCERDEGRRCDLAAWGNELPGASGAVARLDLEAEAVGVFAHA